MKKILIAEGNDITLSAYKEYFSHIHDNYIAYTSNISDLIYYVFYTDTIFDIIIIGDEMVETNLCFGLDNEVDKELEKLKNCKYSPVTLGEICKELSKKVGKPEPDIIIMSTFSFYSFHENVDDVKTFIESKNMKWIDKNRNNDFLGEVVLIFE